MDCLHSRFRQLPEGTDHCLSMPNSLKTRKTRKSSPKKDDFCPQSCCLSSQLSALLTAIGFSDTPISDIFACFDKWRHELPSEFLWIKLWHDLQYTLIHLLHHFDTAERKALIFLACYLEGNHKHSFCFISVLPDGIFIFCYHNNWHLTQAVVVIPGCCIVNIPRKPKFEIRFLA